MSKFCANCGVQADDAAAVCGNCGAPFGATPAADTDVSGKGIGGIKKFIKPAIALIVAAVIIVLGICTISNFTGAKGAARKYCKETCFLSFLFRPVISVAFFDLSAYRIRCLKLCEHIIILLGSDYRIIMFL